MALILFETIEINQYNWGLVFNVCVQQFFKNGFK